MRNRNPIAVFLLPFITLGIYSWYWSVSTKNEMNRMGEKIPTAWIWLIPIVGSIWWLWKYSEGVEHVTKGKLGGVLAFVLLWLLGPIGNAIVQSTFNDLAVVPVGGAVAPVAAAAGPAPDASFGGPTEPVVATATPAETPAPAAEAPATVVANTNSSETPTSDTPPSANPPTVSG